MEFNEKLQYLRKRSQLTQEQLAERLYVSRTAVSKWESGKGYPSIESLRCLSKEFHVSIDELLSGNELLELAETENRNNMNQLCGFIYGLMDIMSFVLIFLPLFGRTESDHIYAVNLLAKPDASLLQRVIYCAILLSMSLLGAVEFVVQHNDNEKRLRGCRTGSLALHAAAVLIFVISRQVYASALLFLALMGKCLLLIRQNKTRS